MYKYLNFPFYDYIHLSLAASASKLSKMDTISTSEPQKMVIVDPIQSCESSNSCETTTLEETLNVQETLNVSLELIGVSPEKSFHIRSYTKDSIEFIWEPGTYEVGNRLCMEWLRNNKSKPVYTIIDIDEIPYKSSNEDSHENIKDYLLPFTTLGIKQKGFLIVNSDSESSEDSVPFDYHIYTTLMELWNTKHYIPKRKALLDSVPGYTNTVTHDIIFDPKFEESIVKPAIFIIDFKDSIKNFIYKLSDCIVLYIGKEENYKNLARE
jgi:hypothetical protein